MKKLLCAVLAAGLLAGLSAFGLPARAQGPERYIAIVYDDSGSMRFDGSHKDVYTNYLYANYALQNFAALMDDSDRAEVFLMSDQGAHPFAVERKENLRQSLKRATTNNWENLTYSTAMDAALRSGGKWLREHPDGEFMFVLMTDGDRMFDGQRAEITDHMDAVFDRYVRDSGIKDFVGRSRALLFSIGRGQALPPVQQMQAALQRTGMAVNVFTADISDQAGAGEAIVATMRDLADLMAQTSRLQIGTDGAFTAQYPLTSLLLMAQLGADGQGGVSAVTGTDGDKLTVERLYNASTTLKDGPAAVYYRVRAAQGDIKPGSYRIQFAGELLAFPMVNLSATVTLRDEAGTQVAQYADGQWNPQALGMEQGAVLTGEARFVGSDGQTMAVGERVRVELTQGPCQLGEDAAGRFTLRAEQPGEGPLSLTLTDQGNFQMALPALNVQVAALMSPQPAASATPGGTAGAQSSAAPVPANLPIVEESSLQAISTASVGFPYTSEAEYHQIAAFTLNADRSGELAADWDGQLPPGLQLRADGTPLDAGRPVLTFAQGQPLVLSLWVNGDFASAPMALTLQMENGQRAQINLQPVARKLKLEVQPAALSFSVLRGTQGLAPVAWTLSVEQNGVWQRLSTASLEDFRISAPTGLGVAQDAQAQNFTLRTGMLPFLLPVGRQVVVLSAGTGKPGETVTGEVAVDIQDDWRKYVPPAVALLALIVVAVYLVLLHRKPRLSLHLEVWKSDRPDMQGAQRLSFRRNRARRALWPFGRETATVDALEFYAHPKSRKLVVLNSTCVQYGLRIDGNGPQYHKEKDAAGDFIISGDNIVALRMDHGQPYAYYRIVHDGDKE